MKLKKGVRGRSVYRAHGHLTTLNVMEAEEWNDPN